MVVSQLTRIRALNAGRLKKLALGEAKALLRQHYLMWALKDFFLFENLARFINPRKSGSEIYFWRTNRAADFGLNGLCAQAFFMKRVFIKSVFKEKFDKNLQAASNMKTVQ